MENFNSKILLNHAIDILKNASINDHEWSVGGGTVLNHYYHHRLSKDIDVFIGDIQMLSLLSPRFNDRAEDSLDYDEMANYISLTYPEGKLDFIVGAQLSKFKPQKKLFMGHYVYLDDPVEIVTKKVFYRGDRVMARDIFDLSIVAATRLDDLVESLRQYPEKVKQFYNNFYNIIKEPDFLNQIPRKNSILLPKESYIKNIVPTCKLLEERLADTTYKIHNIKNKKKETEFDALQRHYTELEYNYNHLQSQYKKITNALECSQNKSNQKK